MNTNCDIIFSANSVLRQIGIKQALKIHKAEKTVEYFLYFYILAYLILDFNLYFILFFLAIIRQSLFLLMFKYLTRITFISWHPRTYPRRFSISLKQHVFS